MPDMNGLLLIAALASVIVALLYTWVVGRHYRWRVFGQPKPADLLPRKRHRVLKSLVIIVSVIFVIVFILVTIPAVLGLINKDLPAVNDADLVLSKLNIPNEQNGFFQVVEVASTTFAMMDPTDAGKVRDIVDGRIWDSDAAARVLANNQNALNALVEGAQKPYFQAPNTMDPETYGYTAILTYLNTTRLAGQYYALDALYLAHSGREQEAFDTALAGVAVGSKLVSSQGSLIHHFVGLSVEQMDLNAIRLIIASSSTSTVILKQIAERLKGYVDDGSGLQKTLRFDYHGMKNTINQLAHGDADAADEFGGLVKATQEIDRTSFFFHPNQTIQDAADYKRKIIEIARLGCGPSQEKGEKIAEQDRYLVAYKQSATNPLSLYLKPNAIGRLLNSIIFVSLSSAVEKHCKYNVLVAATRLTAGLKAYSIEHKGQLPGSLDELVPTYLSDMPLDPFSSQPFKYNPEKKIIYSVGESKKDVGGSTTGTWDHMESPTFSVAF